MNAQVDNQLSGIRPRRTRPVGKQPLKPRQSVRLAPYIALTGMLSLLLMLVLNFSAIANFVNRPITRVVMENEWQHVNESAISQTIGVYLGSGFFDFNVADLQSELEALPWVRQAAITRVWPDSLSLHLEEELAIARWGDRGLLNQQGEIFFPDNAAELATLPRLLGPEGRQAEVMRQYQVLNELLFPAGLRLAELSLSERGSWNLNLNNQIDVVVGREKVIERMNRFIAFYQKSPNYERNQIVAADLRYDNGLAIATADSSLSGVAAR